jgi:exonuclease VII small subunit
VLDFGLQKYQDFKGYLDEYFRGEISKDEILEILEILRERYERQHTDLLEWLERDPVFYKENLPWISTLREACFRFEEARDVIEETLLEDGDDIDEALEAFKEGNRLLNEVAADLEETVERTNIRGYTL